MKRIPLGIIGIAVIMIFAAAATDIFWAARLIGHAFPPSIAVDPHVYDAFALPDILLSLFLYVGAVGLLRLSKLGFVAALVALGMWIFDSILVLGITRAARLNIVVPSLVFAFWALAYLWIKRELFD